MLLHNFVKTARGAQTPFAAPTIGNVYSHEFSEAITDPDLNAWYDSGGAEIGDKCAWQFSSCVNLKTGNWQLQKEWSNSANGCLQQ